MLQEEAIHIQAFSYSNSRQFGKGIPIWPRIRVQSRPCHGVSMSPRCLCEWVWLGLGEARPEASRRQPCPRPPAPAPELWGRYSADRHMRGAFLRGPPRLSGGWEVPPALAFNLVFT